MKPKIIVRYDCCKTSLNMTDYGLQCMQCGTVYDTQHTSWGAMRAVSGPLAPVRTLSPAAAANIKKGFSK